MSDEDDFLSEESYEFEFEDEDEDEVRMDSADQQDSAVCALARKVLHRF